MFDRDPLQMALAEAISHGANQTDLDRLRQHFRHEPATANEVLARILARLGERPARALADAFGLEYEDQRF
jgi:hypothetical protein